MTLNPILLHTTNISVPHQALPLVCPLVLNNPLQRLSRFCAPKKKKKRVNNNSGELKVLKENGQTCIFWNELEAKHNITELVNRKIEYKLMKNKNTGHLFPQPIFICLSFSRYIPKFQK